MEAKGILESIESDEAALEFVESVTRDVSSVQNEALKRILQANSGIDYFKKHGIYGVPSKEEFKTLPLASYCDIEPYVQRIANGDESGTILGNRVNEMLTSSGTSGGKQKLFPKAQGYDAEFVVLNRVARAALNIQAPCASKGKTLQFIYVRKPGITSGGVITCSGLSGYFTSPAFRNRKRDPEFGYTSPDEVIVCVDYHQTSYCHLLCGLAQSCEVSSIGAVFASTFVRGMKELRKYWREISDDIERGSVNTNIVSDLSVKDAVNNILRPNPALANAIRRECSKQSWRGIIRRLFPNVRLANSIVTGSMKQYVPIIDFFTDSLPIASSLYASSECSTLGVNLSPICDPYKVLYTVFPCFAFYEFLAPDGTLVELADVKLGHEYELVVTTKGGLYRYCVGDVLRVVSFHNSAPQFAFMRRAGVLLSVDTDKTDEFELHTAVTNAASALPNFRLLDYTSRIDLSSQPGHYVVYWELSTADGNPVEPEWICAEPENVRYCSNVLERFLSTVYGRNRREGSIGPLEIKVVESGTFDRIVNHVAFSGQGSIGQYKTPRLVTDPAILRILESSVVMSVRAKSS